jgi:adenine-specific DNA glycosylase
VAAQCAARAVGTQSEIPNKKIKPAIEKLARTLLVIRRAGKILLTSSSRVQGFWDLPEPFPGALLREALGTFTHTITHRRYTFSVRRATVRAASKKALNACRWFDQNKLGGIPLGTPSKKALAILAPKS